MKTSKAISLFILSLVYVFTTSCNQGNNKYSNLYEGLPFSMESVKLPKIPNHTYSLYDFGGKGDGVTINTEAFRIAIETITKKGGGKLIVPKGIWLTGPVTLKSNINIHLREGALIIFSKNYDHYPLIDTYFEGLETKRCISPINGKGLENIAITGKGIIDGSGEVWRPVKKNKMTSTQWNQLISGGGVLNSTKDIWYPTQKSLEGANRTLNFNVPQNIKTDEEWNSVKDFLRPVMVSLIDCKNILLQGVIFQNSPGWNLHPLMCNNLILDSVTVRNPWYSQNGDGIDLESSKNVLIVNSSFDVGDDAICIKSGKDEEGRKRGIPTENVIINNCTVFHGHGGFVIGSEMSGGVRNIKVSNCNFIGTDVGLRFKSNRGRGGVVENIFVDNINMINISTEAILFDIFYAGKSATEVLEEGETTQYDSIPPITVGTPIFRKISFNNIKCVEARRAFFFNGLPELNIQDINLENITITSRLGGDIRESDKITLKNVKIINREGFTINFRNAKNIEVDGFSFSPEIKNILQFEGGNSKNIKIKSKTIRNENVSIVNGASKTCVSIADSDI